MPQKKAAALKKRIASFKIDPADLEALEIIQQRDGILKSEQVRRGIKMWIESKDVNPAAPPQKRKRS